MRRWGFAGRFTIEIAGAPAYFCRFVYWIGPVFAVGVVNPEDAGAGAGAGFCFFGFLASLLLLI
jgi:hypothetical protein